MYRFLAFSWTHTNTEKTAEVNRLIRRLQTPLPTKWGLGFQKPGLMVLVASENGFLQGIIPLADGKGVIIGTLFSAYEDGKIPVRVTSISPKTSAVISRTNGRELVNLYWGGYVAFICGAQDEYFVLRDPTGAVPCYLRRTNGISIASSNFEDCNLVTQNIGTLNIRHLASFLSFGHLVSQETGINEITQLRGGEYSKLPDTGYRHFYWTPAAFCKRQVIDAPRDAAKILRKTVEFTARSHASFYSNLLVELSGGLDSSVLLACLSKMPSHHSLTCLNLYTEDSAGDERYFARKVSEQFQYKLIESCFEPQNESLLHILDAEQASSPATVTFRTSTNNFRNQLIRDNRIDAIVSGRGGDQLFQRRRSHHIATEFVDRRGLRSNIFGVANATAKLTGSSIWRVLATIFSHKISPRRHDPYTLLQASPFISKSASDLINFDDLCHPWIKDAESISNSKIQQIFDLIDTQTYFRTERCEDADSIFPFVSQPIIECVLQIPSYILTTGGFDRALLRCAFASDLPPEITYRQSKGDITSYYQTLVSQSLMQIRSFLSEGFLSANQIFDKAALNRALSNQRYLFESNIIAILNAIKAEYWARIVVGR